MTEEQQGVNEAAQAVAEAASNFVEAMCNLFDEVVKVVNEIIESVAEWCQSVCKEIKKYNCNNWRRMHGLPMIHRKGKCRQGRMFHQLL